MRYAILDVEATEPLPAVTLTDGERGVALLVRRFGRPIHFSFQDLESGARLEPHALSRSI